MKHSPIQDPGPHPVGKPIQRDVVLHQGFHLHHIGDVQRVLEILTPLCHRQPNHSSTGAELESRIPISTCPSSTVNLYIL